MFGLEIVPKFIIPVEILANIIVLFYVFRSPNKINESISRPLIVIYLGFIVFFVSEIVELLTEFNLVQPIELLDNIFDITLMGLFAIGMIYMFVKIRGALNV